MSSRGIAGVLVALSIVAYGTLFFPEASPRVAYGEAGHRASTTSAAGCGSIVVVAGLSSGSGDAVTLLTNGLLGIPLCDRDIELRLDGTGLDGIGAAVAMWDGTGSPMYADQLDGRVSLRIDPSLWEGPLFIGFTNDVANDRGDRNLTVAVQ